MTFDGLTPWRELCLLTSLADELQLFLHGKSDVFELLMKIQKIPITDCDEFSG